MTVDSMAERENDLLHVELIKRKTLTPQEASILDAFACHNASTAVARIDSNFPTLADVKSVENYLWDVWEVMIAIVRSPDVTNEVHEYFVGVLQGLSRVAKGEVLVWTVSISSLEIISLKTDCIPQGERRVWADLPLFYSCMNAWFNSTSLNPTQQNPSNVA